MKPKAPEPKSDVYIIDRDKIKEVFSRGLPACLQDAESVDIEVQVPGEGLDLVWAKAEGPAIRLRVRW